MKENKISEILCCLIICIAIIFMMTIVSAETPTIEFISVPEYGSDGYLQGRVTGVTTSDYKIAVYIYDKGWYNKPTWTQPLTSIDNNGNWNCNIVTGENDEYATKIRAYLVPNGYNVPMMDGDEAFPTEIDSNAIANKEVTRQSIPTPDITTPTPQPPTPIPPTPDIPTPNPSKPSIIFSSDKNSYVRNDLIYLTMKNEGDQPVILSNSNSVHWWIENIIYNAPDNVNTVSSDESDSSASAIAISDSEVYNTQLFPDNTITLPWDQRDNSKNLVSQGKYRACVRWSFNEQNYQSCTPPFDITIIETPTPPPTINTPTPTPTPIPTPTIIYTPTITHTVPAIQTPHTKKDTFRIGPTVNLRPANDEMTKEQDGLIELYMDNPSLNEVVMYADVIISVPSGINVYGQGFGDAGSAGVLHGAFDIAPGKAKTIQMTIKAEKTGKFTVKFSGTYWPGSNKDAFQPISLTRDVMIRDIPTPSIAPTVTVDKDPGIMEGFGIFIKSILHFLDSIV